MLPWPQVIKSTLFLLLFPVFLSAQTPVYSDSLFAPGAEPNVLPMTNKEKIGLELGRTVAPKALFSYLFVAGIAQAKNSPGEWGRSWSGFGKRYGSGLAVNGIQEVLNLACDTAFHQDPRYFRSTQTSFGPRLHDALLQTLIAHTDSGGRALSIGNIVGSYGATQAARLWLPRNQASAGDGLIYGTVLIGAIAGRNIVKEFWPDVREKFKHHK